MTPRERRHQRTKQAILTAAREIVREDGLEKLSIRAIAKKIDYSPAGLYEYFGNKEEIICAVAQEGHLRLKRAMDRVDKTLPDSIYLRELGMAYIRFAQEEPDYFLLMFTLISDETPEEYVVAMNDEATSSFPILVGAIERAINNGLFTAREQFGAAEMALQAWFLVHGFAMLRLTQLRDNPELDGFVGPMMDNFVRGMQA